MPIIPPMKRRQHSLLARRLSVIPLWLLLVPIFRVLEWLGIWPQKILGKGMHKFFQWPKDLHPGQQDIVVSSYFKSGTNWMLQIATQIAWRGKADFNHIHDLVPWPELPDKMQTAVSYDAVNPADSPSGLRIVKTHFAPEQGMPWSEQTRYICVIRDPKAVFESSFHFIRDTSMGPLVPSLTHWLGLFLSEGALFGPWSDFTARCWELRQKPNVLFLTYEQMKNDLPGTVAKVATFMNVALTPAEQAAVVEQAGFAHMKAIGHKFDPVGIGPPWAKPEGAMVRKGSSKTHEELVPGGNRRINEWCRSRLLELNSDFPFDEHYG